MHVTILSLYGAISPHLETELELAQLHLDRGDDVTMIYCDGALSFCVINPRNDLSMCRVCQHGRKIGLDLLTSKISAIPLSSVISSVASRLKNTAIPSGFMTFEALFNFAVDDFKIGASVISSLNFITENAKPDIVKYSDFIQRAIRSGLAIYMGLQRYFANHHCDCCYIFNGRLAETRGAIRACEKNNVEFYTHERSRDLNSYMLVKNTLPHDREYIKKDITHMIAEAPSHEKMEALAEEFYSERKQGVMPSWFSFLTKQVKGTLPEDWINASNRIAVFSSTEAEMAALPEFYSNLIYGSQREALIRLIRDLSTRGFQGKLAVRMHPNSKEPFDLETELKDVPRDFLYLISPDSEIDTYALMETCDKVVTFGSTMGIEAVYWGKPSILLGPSIYEHLGGTYNPTSHVEAMELLLRPLEPKGKDAAIGYGYYQKSYGYEFVYVQASALYRAAFKNKELNLYGLSFYLHRIWWIIHDLFLGEYQKRKRKFSANGLIAQ